MNRELLKIYTSKNDCVLNSMKDFKMQFNERSIADVCLGKRKTHKDYIFSYKPLDENFVYINERLSPVYVYDLEMNFLKYYESTKIAAEKSEEDFGIKFIAQNISSVCSGKYKQYKGYIFSHTKLHND